MHRHISEHQNIEHMQLPTRIQLQLPCRRGQRLFALFLLVLAFAACKKVKIGDVDTNPLEECISFSPTELELNSDSVPVLLYGNEVIDYFPNVEEGEKALKTIQYFGFNKKCRCGNGELTSRQGTEMDVRLMEYWLKDDHAMNGDDLEEDCISFNPDKLVARKLGKNWTIVERPGHLMFAFGKNKQACINALKVIKKYGFTESCFVGRALPSMQYLKGEPTVPLNDPKDPPAPGPIFTNTSS